MTTATEQKCIACHEKGASSEKELKLVHAGFTFLFRNPGECIECAQRTLSEAFNASYAEYILSLKGEELKVSWEAFAHFKHHGEDSERVQRTISLLDDLGLFSISAEETWMVTDGNLNLNPSIGGVIKLYFIRQEDAEGYARHFFGKTHYSWEIRFIGRVIPNDAVMSHK